jgi:hypothetical protein
MSDTGSDDVHASGDEASISVAVRELCNQLRANDPQLLRRSSTLRLDNYMSRYSNESECIAVYQALEENTSVKHIDFGMVFERHNFTKRSPLAAAVYLESSKTLQTLNLGYGPRGDSYEVREMISLVLRALSRNTSVTKLIIYTQDVGLASVAFRELLTCTLTLQKLQLIAFGDEAFDERQIAAIASGFAHNTTLRDLELESCREAYLVPVLTALQRHPAL